MRLNVVVAALFVALPFARSEAASLSVREIRSSLPPAEKGAVDPAELAEQVRDVARRILPDLTVTEEGGAADLEVCGELIRREQEYLVTLELREAKPSKLTGTAAAAANTPEELIEAVASASVDLFRGYQATSSLVMAAETRPAPPAPLGKLDAAGVDANVLVAIDEARSAEAQNPEEAAAAWRAAAELPGRNALRETAANRAREWQAYAEAKRAFKAQRGRDKARLKQVLPLAAVTDATKVELLVRYTRAYGAVRATALLPLLPLDAREGAELAIGCEAKEAANCVALARAATEAKIAVDYLDQACAAGDLQSCAEAGDRLLRQETRDPARAVAVLQRGCAAGGGAACARLARIHEEGDGAPVSLALAAETREQACSAGDGASCRKLACDVPAALPRATELWQRGCKDGDSISCALARFGAPRAASQGTVIESQVAEATPGVRPASTAPVATPAVPSAPAVSTVPAAQKSKGHHGAGFALVTIGLLAGGGALLMSSDGPGYGGHRMQHDNWLSARAPSASTGRNLSLVLGGAAVLSAATGIALLLSKPDAPEKLSVGVSPAGLVLSGQIP